jgi:hypothetical protein
MYPLISDLEISNMKTEEEIKKAHERNRRTELRILRTDYQD